MVLYVLGESNILKSYEENECHAIVIVGIKNENKKIPFVRGLPWAMSCARQQSANLRSAAAHTSPAGLWIKGACLPDIGVLPPIIPPEEKIFQ